MYGTLCTIYDITPMLYDITTLYSDIKATISHITPDILMTSQQYGSHHTWHMNDIINTLNDITITLYDINAQYL